MFNKIRTKGTLRKRQQRTAYRFLAPVLSLYMLFWVIPVGISIYVSFTEYSVLESPKWVGLRNYGYLFFEDDIFKISIRSTSLYVLGATGPSVLLGLLFAVLLDRALTGRGVFRSCIYLPYVTPIAAAALVWMFLYEPSRNGFVNYLLSFFGLGPIEWLESTRWALPSIIFVGIWRTTGYNMVLFLAGLQGIPKRYYESASIDGANSRQQFWYIMLPLLKPVTAFVLVMNTINSYQILQEPYIMTEGGPAHTTTTITYWLYLVGFRSLDFGTGAAISVILAMMIFVLSIFYLKLLRWR